MKKFNIKVDGVMHEVEVEEVGGSVGSVSSFTPAANVTPASSPSEMPQATQKVEAGAGSVLAPLQGTVQQLK